MGTITTSDSTEIFFKDWGSGQPIVFSHGWPLSGDDWDTQMLFFLRNGYRVIAHDRRGHGRSSQTGEVTTWTTMPTTWRRLLPISIFGTPSTLVTPRGVARSSATSPDTVRAGWRKRCSSVRCRR